MISTRNDIGSGQHMLTLHAFVVDQSPVGTVVDENVASRSGHHLSVPARHVFRTQHDVASGIAPDEDRSTTDLVFPTVGQRHEATASTGRGTALGFGFQGSAERRGVYCLYVLRAAAASIVHKQQFLASYLNLVAVQQRSWLRSQAYSIDQYFRVRIGVLDRHLTIRHSL
jgi:hypothetical protein